MKKAFDLAVTLLAFAVLLTIYDYVQRSDEESAQMDLAAWQGKLDK